MAASAQKRRAKERLDDLESKRDDFAWQDTVDCRGEGFDAWKAFANQPCSNCGMQPVVRDCWRRGNVAWSQVRQSTAPYR